MATRWISPPLACKMLALAPAALALAAFALSALPDAALLHGFHVSPYATRWS